VDGISQMVGSFLFLFDKNENVFRNAELIEMFALQVGQYIERKRAEAILMQKMTEMERFHKLTINRELNMIELKKEVNELLREAGKADKYLIVSN
jgi:Tfp pilus assembly protein PilE